MRLLHGPPGRCAGLCVPGRGRSGRGPRGRHRRGPGRLRPAPRGRPPGRWLRLRRLRHLPGRRPALAGEAPGQPDWRSRGPVPDPAGVHRQPAPSSAVSAPRVCWSPPTSSWSATPPRPTRTSARPSPATSAAAPVTRRSSTRSASRPPVRKRRSDDHGHHWYSHQHHPGLQDQGRHRRVDAAPGRHPQGHRRVRVLLGHVARGHALGPDAPLHGRPRRDQVDRHLRGRRDARRLRRADLRRPAHRGEELRPGDPGHPGPGARQGPPPRRAGGAGRRRPPGDRAPRRRQDQDRVRGAAGHHGRGVRDRPRRDPGPRGPRRPPHRPRPAPQHRAPPADRARRRRRGRQARRRDRQGRVHLRHAGPGLPRPRVRSRRAVRGRRRRAVRGHPVAALGPQADRPRPRPARGEGPDDALRRRRRLRRPRGHLDADPRLSAGAAHRQAGQDRL